MVIPPLQMSDTERKRSVNDYACEQSLKEALFLSSGPNSTRSRFQHHGSSVVSEDGLDIPLSVKRDLDWYIPDIDVDTSEAQTVANEMRRLLVLKSYSILDKELRESRETSLDRLASLAARMFDVSMAFVTIIDLGRAVFLAKSGLAVDEVPRKGTFCAHAVLSNHDIFIVPDASKDVRFKEFPAVAGPMHCRFYAGCPLFAAEGCRLGVFGIWDNKPRPNGLTSNEKEILRELAGLAMDEIVRYRTIQQQRKEQLTSSQMLASVAHDLLTPLTGVQLSLSSLGSDKSFQGSIAEDHKECIATASTCADVMVQICETLRSNHVDRNGDSQTSSPNQSIAEAPVHAFYIKKLVNRLHQVMDTLPKVVPMVISVDAEVPEKFVGNELAIFRAALNLLAYSCDRAKTGSVRMRVRLGKCCIPNRTLQFECEDSGARIEPQFQAFDATSRPDESVGSNYDAADNANHWSTMGLKAAMTQIRLLNGDAGVLSLENEAAEASHLPTTRFWFCVPFCLPRESAEEVTSSTKRALVADGENSSASSSRQKRALVIEDSTVVRKILARTLSQLGYETAQAVDGMEGLKQMQSSTYDLVLCDFLMPVMDGLDCVRAYRKWEEENRPGFHQYIVGISAHASAGCVSRALSLGMNGYRAKPLSVDTLKDLAATADSLALTSCLDNVEHTTDDEESPITKKRKLSIDRDERVCLVASDEGSVSGIKDLLTRRGWHAVVASDDKEVLRFMKERNWGMVLLDGDEPSVSGAQCVAEFRVWEQQNRVRRQRHVYLLSAGFRSISPTSGSISVVQLPSGIDGAIGKPVRIKDLEPVLNNVEEISTFDANDIVV